MRHPTIALLLILVLTSPLPTGASPVCPVGTLADYQALGSCTFDHVTLSDFTYKGQNFSVGNIPGGTINVSDIPPGAVSLVPNLLGPVTRLTFGTKFPGPTLSDGSPIQEGLQGWGDLRFQFRATADPSFAISALALSLLSVSSEPESNPGGAIAMTGLHGSLLKVFYGENATLYSSTTFSPVEQLDIFGSGIAFGPNITSFAVDLTTGPFVPTQVPVPEPTTSLWLLATSVAGLALVRWVRRHPR
jgi:hypothetical protein